jgi:4-alpha-glucanotransferase
MSEPSALRMLAARMGIVDSYIDIHGAEHATSDATRVAVLHAMGVEAADEPAALRELDRLDAERAERLLEPVSVVHAHVWQMPALDVPAGAEWSAELMLDGGAVYSMHGVGGPGATAPTSPAPLPMGYHELRLTVATGGRTKHARQMVIVPPAQCMSVERKLGGRRATGVLANLYSVRSAANWGVGDAGDLRALADRAAQNGDSFVGVNPLHALRNSGWDVSPYSPVSRLFRNPIYLDVSALPELAESPDGRALLAGAEFGVQLEALRSLPLVDYDAVMKLKRRVLEPLHRAFAEHHRDRDTPRGRAYAAYRMAQGQALDRFAVFCALSEQMAGPGGHGAQADWHDWPAPLRDAQSSAVADFARAHAGLVDFHRYLQFALDAQLADAGASLALGIYQDLAVGSAPGGSDTWAWPELFAQGVSVGAPPDDFAAEGQNWGLPPLVPHALRNDRYAYLIGLLRAAFAHSGALRIDHVMGLFRLFWIPAGMSGRDGAYVRYPSQEMLAIVALESWRHRAPVVGENLGTVPPEVGPAMDRHGMLGSAVMYFERDGAGEFLPARDYPARTLVTAGTHDHVPLAGFWAGRDLEIRRTLGLLADDDALQRAREARERDRRALVARLNAEGLQIAVGGDTNVFVDDVHRFLGRTPSAMLGVALDDLALETDPVNVPGTANDRYANWQRKMGRPLEEIAIGPRPV